MGLTAVTRSRAVIVDASPPIAGHVYDVTTNTQTRDTDYMVSIMIYCDPGSLVLK